jgi:hypothetical protein
MARQGTHFQLLQSIAGVVLAGSGPDGAAAHPSHFFCATVKQVLDVLFSVILSLGQAWLFCAFGHHPTCEYVIQFAGPLWRLAVAIFAAI